MAVIPIGRRIRDLAEADPTRPSVTCAGETISRAELEHLANQLGRAYQDLGVVQGDLVTIALPNSIEFYVASVALWKIGATPQPVSWRLPDMEREAIVELADSRLVLGVPPGSHGSRVCLPAGFSASSYSADPLPDVVSPCYKAPTSGGSTGRPKLILAGNPGVVDVDAPPPLMMTADGCQVVPGPLYHNGPFVFSMGGLFSGSHIVVEPRFDAERTLRLIEEHQCDWIFLVPTMMQRIWRLPIVVRERYDLSSLRIMFHLAAPCPPWLKHTWIEWLGPEIIWELYAGTEAQGATLISGKEWLDHVGSVGRPAPGSMQICSPTGEVLASGEVGEVWMKTPEKATYHYRGAEARTMDGGWESLGDMGWMDDDGYLYLSDRRTDMILAGGANIYPAEVEGAIEEFPGVQGAVVIGLPDEDLGKRVHAIVCPEPGVVLSEQALTSFVAERLVRYKVPRTWEFVDELLRDDSGKVRRSALIEERIAAG